MERLLAYISILQGVFLCTTPYLDDKSEECEKDGSLKTTQYIHSAVGSISVLFGTFLLLNENLLSPLTHIGIIACLFSIAVIATIFTYIANPDCKVDWLFFEQLALALVFVVAFVGKYRSQNSY